MSTGQCLVEGDLDMRAADFEAIASMIHADAGIKLQIGKATLVYSRLAKRVRGLGLRSFAPYCALLASSEGREEREAMLGALTTNVTRFFREPHHFEHLSQTILPPLLRHARNGGRVRLWSSACSNGQEPYSIALSLLALCPEAARYDIRILATDIDPAMVAAGAAGEYDGPTVQAVPAEMRRRWFEPGSGRDMLRVNDTVRSLVSFKRLNLIGQWPIRRPFQAIFCRNVMIYFEQATQTAIWLRMIPLLTPDGALYIGHSERILPPAADKVQLVGVTTYQHAAKGQA